MTAAIEEREVSLTAPAHDLAPRVVSFDPADFDVPTGREEEWRFTPLARIGGLHDGTAGPGTDLTATWQAAPGVLVQTVDRYKDPRIGSIHTPTDRVAATAFTGTGRAVVVAVPADLESQGATTVTLRGTGGTQFGHLLVSLAANSAATVILEHVGSAMAATNVELEIGPGARLTFVSVQQWDDDAVHLSQQHARLDRDAHFRSVVVTLGGSVVRLMPSAEYTGPGGDVELIGVYFADAGQHLEHRLFVDHAVPDCRSDAIYKGALQGDGAHSVWIGDVLIRAAATGTKTFELNRNLVLTKGARADSVPNLEIETGRIEGAGHASATGRFDDEQLFYLMSRGVPEAVAKRLVVRGFFADAIHRIGVPEVAQRLIADVDAELGAIDPLYDFADADPAGQQLGAPAEPVLGAVGAPNADLGDADLTLGGTP